MKKLALTVAIVLGLGLTTFADPTTGLFNRGYNAENGFSSGIYFSSKDLWDADPSTSNPIMPVLPIHAQDSNQDAPVGSGIALLLGLGGAYLVAKKRREE